MEGDCKLRTVISQWIQGLKSLGPENQSAARGFRPSREDMDVEGNDNNQLRREQWRIDNLSIRLNSGIGRQKSLIDSGGSDPHAIQSYIHSTVQFPNIPSGQRKGPCLYSHMYPVHLVFD